MKLRLIGRRNIDTNQYDLPTSIDIGGLIVGDIGEYEFGRDITIENKTNVLQRITKLHLSYMLYYILYCFLMEKMVIESIYNRIHISQIKNLQEIESL